MYTESGKTIKLTHAHLLPTCNDNKNKHELIKATDVKAGKTCLKTVA